MIAEIVIRFSRTKGGVFWAAAPKGSMIYARKWQIFFFLSSSIPSQFSAYKLNHSSTAQILALWLKSKLKDPNLNNEANIAAQGLNLCLKTNLPTAKPQSQP